MERCLSPCSTHVYICRDYHTPSKYHLVAYLNAVARLATEPTPIGVVSTAERSCTDRDIPGPKVTFHRLPDHEDLGQNIAGIVKPREKHARSWRDGAVHRRVGRGREGRGGGGMGGVQEHGRDVGYDWGQFVSA